MSSEVISDDLSVGSPVPWRSASSLANLQRACSPDQEEAARLEQARMEGFAAGLAAARDENEQQLVPSLKQAAATLAALAGSRSAIRHQSTPDLTRLSTTIASRVIHADTAVDPDALEGLLGAAFTKLSSHEVCRALIHPAIELQIRRYLHQLDPSAPITVIADGSLPPGTVRFEAPSIAWDDTANAQLGEIERGLIDKLAD